jgi:hypothetical protein
MGSQPLERHRGYICKLLILFILTYSGLGVDMVSAAEHTHVVFEDGFEDGASEAWRMWSPEEATEDSGWAVLYDGGNNVLSMRGNVFAEVGDGGWSNYTVEARVKFRGIPDGAHVSVRVGEPAPRYFIRLTDQGVFLTKEKKSSTGQQNDFIDIAVAPEVRFVERWYTVKVACDGTRLTVYIDDEMVLDHVDADEPILVGGIALESARDSVIYFDDVKILVTYREYIDHLLVKALGQINEARAANAYTVAAEYAYEKAQVKLEEGDLAEAERLTREAISSAKTAIVAASEPQPQQSVSGGSFWSIEVVAGVVSIGAAGVGVVGWALRERSARRRGRVLFRKLMEEVDSVYGSFKMNSRRCEAELLRLRGEVLAGFKEGVLEEENLHALEGRIEAYMRDVRKEIEKEDS